MRYLPFLACAAVLAMGCSKETLPAQASLIKVGDKAPMVMLTTPEGGPLNIEERLKGKRALILDFWFYD